ncbi:MAG: 16S rRNA (uracil(1498)-N(3))-methyltransferase [Gemmatimonadaceae bacterium]|nr:16S rRNA (uracil(1498)-N(3))-methyltransferase [Gemmatimonadaceae bacterium]
MERVDRPAVVTFFSGEPLLAGRSVSLGADEAHHARVRRVDVGSRVRIVDGSGSVAHGTLVKLAKGQATADVDTVSTSEPPAPIHFLVPVADRDRMLWLAEKGVELGISSWRPVIWRRSRSVSPRGEGTGFQAKVRSRMVAALKQCGSSWLPVLHPDASVERAIAAAATSSGYLLDADGPPILSKKFTAPIVVALGPEGGMDMDERSAFMNAGFEPVSLAEHTLRFETAGIAALATIRAALTVFGNQNE